MTGVLHLMFPVLLRFSLDEGQVVFYENPNSYTGEDLGELFCHGSAAIYQFLIESACSAGARIANPGEFTRRAFLEGKIDQTTKSNMDIDSLLILA